MFEPVIVWVVYIWNVLCIFSAGMSNLIPA